MEPQYNGTLWQCHSDVYCSRIQSTLVVCGVGLWYGCRTELSILCVSQYAEVSCFDDVALLYHLQKQCNSIVIAFGLRPVRQQQCSVGTDAAKWREVVVKVAWVEGCR